MSRHVVDENDCKQIVVGYDRHLQQMFGQVYGEAPNGRNRRGPIGGWPTKTGLGIEPPLRAEREARQAVFALVAWLRGRGVPPAKCASVGAVLLQEWREDVA